MTGLDALFSIKPRKMRHRAWIAVGLWLGEELSTRSVRLSPQDVIKQIGSYATPQLPRRPCPWLTVSMLTGELDYLYGKERSRGENSRKQMAPAPCQQAGRRTKPRLDSNDYFLVLLGLRQPNPRVAAD
jgi:hypothetical protein